MATRILRLDVGDVVLLKKPHPCGGREWEVLRTGADVRARCRGCGRVVMMPRVRFERRVVSFVSRSSPEAPPVSGAT